MKFGVQIENHLGFTFDAVSGIAKEAEQLGFNGLFICDHLTGRNETAARQPCLDPWVTLGALAQTTKTLQLGTLVTAVGFRNPAILAKMAATLDNISNGRLQLSMGAGWYEPEYSSYGIPFPSTKQRMQQLREAIQIIKATWTQDKPSFSGKNYTIKDAWSYPKPVQKPEPNIWVGGTGEKTLLRIVAELADGWNATGTAPEEYEKKLKVLGSFCTAAGRTLESIERSYYAFALTAGNEPEFSRSFEKYYSTFKRPEETVESFTTRVRGSGRSFVGTVTEIVEKVDKFRKLGVTYMILYFPDKDQLGIMKQFAKHVISRFRDC
ncbi:hypothetical protein AUG19_03990 [archaeon 13_1_20CM_2_54_9]|nr:MAG: hypothetical protein AUJ07_06600 [Crenarchaeota archaeon 13_1_40CM_3_53_5]OLE75981.1 MAG: hypothetical protein AUG19_03990 [archaeon 13_1_20CM_2_54_9]TMI26560.1 MAG: TIGR03560 family F420-dependent LLM class oxidoreductase [Candidatus Bathyarchaeota archaeon]TMI31599.1 MAG: TIGR03560 family F420-dependent LLM class oxidoreductase [Candidatus Bathyarchaeota archaeon]